MGEASWSSESWETGRVRATRIKCGALRHITRMRLQWSKLPWDRLENWGLSLQVVKTAIAAGLAWGLAAWLLRTPRPYFAPLAAILSLQATVQESLSRGIQRIVGVVGGILLAMVFAHRVGLNTGSLTVLVFVALAVATRLRLGPQGVPQVAISALLVLAVGNHVQGYAWQRVMDTILGAVVAMAVAALAWPPDFTPEANQAVALLSQAVRDVMRGIQEDLAGGLDPDEANRHLARARQIDRALGQARTAIKRAETSLRWNPWARGRRQRLDRLAKAVVVLDHAVSQVRGIARTLFVTLDRDVTQPGAMLPKTLAAGLAQALAVMADALDSYAQVVTRGHTDAAAQLEAWLDQADRLRDDLVRQAGTLLLPGHGRKFLDMAAVLVDLEKMSQDLRVSARYLVPLVVAR
ncbi:protein of unknown function DUF939 [Sulfobacillus acidophilus DSM 10332]|uniref:FUSC family protein n=1 Tax=Sulfobacillus acidophilus (strain ATCC 700253 / DSM 10332 / NAL) TaxID=679936 RepID=G8TS74_SULAD|nr:protein of unknown function DUF939 [Sulfobacillus acidophilus DSM 10332]